MRTMIGFFAAFALGAFSLVALADSEPQLEGLKCPISKQAIDAEQFVEHNGGKVYFCCENCPGAFSKDNEDHVARANHQLVASHQATQAKCPISGGNTKDNQSVEVEGVTVNFCCKNCKAKVNGEEGDARLKLVFNADAFAKAFVVGDAEEAEE
ncbi:MAG: hypothetical protein DWQ42_16030 [Planctomycetota bacterium]|nr:MAG: hypothetical protein DWQ42_16030 [Planctomycetota bacterium]REK43394.1 MAG: hypothetical protein DWQ46_11730 [Planctomycetota bacterium]